MTEPTAEPTYVLIVDDVPANLVVMEAILEDPGRRLLTATSGIEALNMVASHDIAVVLLDIMMPEMDGYDVARAMREETESAEVPIIFVTAMDRTLDRERLGYRVGAIDVLFKPVDDVLVLAKVEAFESLWRARRKAERASRYFEAILARAATALFVLDKAGRLKFANADAQRLSGRYAGELEGKTCGQLFDGRDDDLVGVPAAGGALSEISDASLRYILNADGSEVSLGLRSAGDARTPVAVAGSIIWDGHGEIDGIVLVVRDVQAYIAQRKGELDSLARLHQLADHDPLTGLPNRTLFCRNVNHTLSDGGRADLLMIAIDGFDQFVDRHGALVADRLSRQLVAVVRRSVRDIDLVASLGRHQLAVAMRGEAVPVDHVVQRVLAAVNAPIRLGRVTYDQGVSLSYANSEPGDTASELLRKLDVAMCGARAAGGARAQRWSVAAAQAISGADQREARLRAALDNQSFVLHYQPIVRLGDDALVGAEVLLRWAQPDGSLEPPASFVPLLERSGLVAEVGAWVIREACAKQRAWRSAGLDLFMSVNVSAHQFVKGPNTDQLWAALATVGVGVDLHLEVTESVLMSDLSSSHTLLAALRAHGCRVVIDDFGTGHSSMAYLRQLPVDILKIDHSFLRGVPADRDGAAILRAMLALAHSLGVDVTAEGVETAAQRAFLAAEGCTYAQGHLLAAPMDADAFLAWAGART